MELRPLGSTGLQVSSLCLGCMNFGSATDRDTSTAIIHRALDAGINLLDTADMYGEGASEAVVGDALKGRRDRVLVATKAHFPTSDDPNDRGNSRRHLIRAVEASLRRLKTDWVDLFQLHRPDPLVPIEDTLRTLDDLVSQGKIRYAGCSTFPPWRIMEALGVSKRRGLVRFASEQPPYNLLDRRIERDLVPLAQAYDLALFPWSPLAMGMLAGRYAVGQAAPQGSRVARLGPVYGERVTDGALRVAEELATLARDIDMEPATMALAWVRSQPAITAPILGPRTEEQLAGFLAAADTILSAEVLARIDAIAPPGSAVADFQNNTGCR